MRVWPRGLRARSTASSALLAMLLSVLLSVTTYQVARWYLLDQRQELAVRQAVLHSRVIAGELSGQRVVTADEVVAALNQTRGRAVLRVGDDWYAAVVDLNESRVPEAVITGTDAGTAQRQRVMINQVPYFVVGIPLTSLDVTYVEFVPAVEYERTLRTLGMVLTVVASITTGFGALAGWLLSRRVLRPIAAVSATAEAMSGGDLRRRLDVSDDPDLEPVAKSFNSMADSLQERIAREQRFTADVSHELRTPLTAMSAAVSLAKRASSPERTEFAVDVIAGQVEHLQHLTLELLELSRIDAQRSDGEKDLVDVAAIVRRQASAQGVLAAVTLPDGLPVVHTVNPLRFDRIVANLLENACRYGGGPVAIDCRRSNGTLRLVVDDAGPGVADHERSAIFERFHRGSVDAAPSDSKGTGLGLSLVDEYTRLEGGTVWVETSPQGGARFVVEMPEAP